MPHTFVALIFLPLLGSMHTTFTMITFIILALFHTALHHFIFISQLFPGISGIFHGIVGHFCYKIYCFEEFSGHLTSSHFLFLFISWVFLGISGLFSSISEHFWYEIYFSEQVLSCFTLLHIIS